MSLSPQTLVAIDRIIDRYKIDLTSWLERDAPASDRTEAAYGVIMIQKHMINCEINIIRDLEYVQRMAGDALTVPSMFSAGTLVSAADSLLRHQTQLGTLTECRDLAVLPFLRKE